MRNVVIQTVNLRVNYEQAFMYIANPMHQKEWAVHFIKEVKKEGTGYLATTIFGETILHIEADERMGTIDISMGKGPATCTRLIRNEEGCTYIFALLQPKNMPDEIWEKEGISNLIEELQLLKSILED